VDEAAAMKIRTLSIALALAACSPPNPEGAKQDDPAASIATEPAPASMDVAVLDTPLPGARVTSPLRVTGTAPANWYFENQFPVRLVDAQGADITMAPATPRVNWTENAEPKVFDAELTFNVTVDTPATLVLQEDMPREDATPRETRVPVVLTPQ
jgi:hypothetical protein